MQLPSSVHRDVVPDHIDPIPFPETLQEAHLLYRLMDVNIRLATIRNHFTALKDRDELIGADEEGFLPENAGNQAQ